MKKCSHVCVTIFKQVITHQVLHIFWSLQLFSLIDICTWGKEKQIYGIETYTDTLESNAVEQQVSVERLTSRFRCSLSYRCCKFIPPNKKHRKRRESIIHSELDFSRNAITDKKKVLTISNKLNQVINSQKLGIELSSSDQADLGTKSLSAL